jgi:hypothetical protein
MENTTPSTPLSPEVKIPQGIPPKSGYYTSTKRKVGDFFIGFFGGVVLTILFSFLSSFLFRTSENYSLAVSSLSLVVTVFLIIFLFRKGRRFIAIGLISMALLPLLAFGSCLLILTGLGSTMI